MRFQVYRRVCVCVKELVNAYMQKNHRCLLSDNAIILEGTQRGIMGLNQTGPREPQQSLRDCTTHQNTQAGNNMLPHWGPQMGSRGAMRNFLLREQHRERMGEHNPLAGSDRRDRKPKPPARVT